MVPDKVRRLSIVNTMQNVQKKTTSGSQLRSLLIFGAEDSFTDFPIPKLFPTGLQLLTVLDLEGAHLEIFPREVVKLLLLKYLSLRNSKVKEIPSSIKKLQYLETLDLKHSHVVELPAEIMNLKRLRHLLVYRYEVESYARFNARKGVKVPAGILWLAIAPKAVLYRGQSRQRGVPSGIEHLTNLKLLEFFDMPDELFMSLQPDGGEDHLKGESSNSGASVVRRLERNVLWKV
ncbi:hypothetical protein M0R45_025270 [Rubus argutus]